MFEREYEESDNEQLQKLIDQTFNKQQQKAKSGSSKGNYKVNLSADLIRLGTLIIWLTLDNFKMKSHKSKANKKLDLPKPKTRLSSKGSYCLLIFRRQLLSLRATGLRQIFYRSQCLA